jgi:hypothetical protein
MEIIVNNWYIILALAAVLGMATWYIYRYFNLPSEAQLAKVREWLLWAVTEAEKELGGGTGKLKLRQVYDLFVTRFPWLARIVPFDLFSSMVDDALEEMREMLKTNQAVKAHVNGEGGGNE